MECLLTSFGSTPSSSQIQSPFLPFKIWCPHLFLFLNWPHTILAAHLGNMEGWTFTGAWSASRGHSWSRLTLPPLSLLIATNALSVLPPFTALGSCLYWVCAGLGVLSQRLWVHMYNDPAISGKLCFIITIYHFQLWQSFCLLFPNGHWTLRLCGLIQTFHLKQIISKFLFFCILMSCLHLC